MPIDNNIDKNLKYGILENSFLKNNIYKIQKFFLIYDKVELFFSNPTNSKIYFEIDKNHSSKQCTAQSRAISKRMSEWPF